MGRIALSRTGRVGHNSLVVVTESVNISCFKSVAVSAFTLFFALYGAGRRGGFCPLTVAVTRRVNASIYVAVGAACTGMGRIALSRTGRVGHNSLVVVSESIYLSCFIRVAVSAFTLFLALCGAGGRCGFCPLAITVTRRVNVSIYVAVRTTSAGMRCVTLLRAGRVGHNSLVVVSESIYLSCFIRVAVSTFALFFALCRTGGCCGFCPLAVAVTRRVNVSIYVAVGAASASMRCITLSRTGRVGHNSLIVVTESVNFSCFKSVAVRTFTLFLTFCSAGGRYGFRPLTVAVTCCVNVCIYVAVRAARAGVSCVTLSRTGRCCYNCFIIMSERRQDGFLGALIRLAVELSRERACGFAVSRAVRINC